MTYEGPLLGVTTGEPGLFVSKIKRDFEFDGYMGNTELSAKKIIRDVSSKGDVFFNTGDIMTLDKDYFVYFTDRIGDTFRWVQLTNTFPRHVHSFSESQPFGLRICPCNMTVLYSSL